MGGEMILKSVYDEAIKRAEEKEEKLREKTVALEKRITSLEKDLEVQQEKLDSKTRIVEMIEALLQFRELIENYENQFTVFVPDALNPSRIDHNYYKVFQNRIERWRWILSQCPDERAQFLSKVLKGTSTSNVDLIDHFCTLVSVLYAALSKKVHFPETKKKYELDEIITSLKTFGIISETDSWMEDVVRIFVKDLASVPSPFTAVRQHFPTQSSSSEEPDTKRMKST